MLLCNVVSFLICTIYRARGSSVYLLLCVALVKNKVDYYIIIIIITCKSTKMKKMSVKRLVYPKFPPIIVWELMLSLSASTQGFQ